MNNNDLLNKLLGISNLRVVKSEFIGEEKLHLEVVSTLPVAGCPDCGRISNQVHDKSEVQMIRDLSISERPLKNDCGVGSLKWKPCHSKL
ncbi:MAG: hypothetical protein AB1403_25875 [Candidatus Riflebacteria bacterium]